VTTTTDAAPKCPHCGELQSAHKGQCHRVKAIEYHENGMVKRVEYMTPADYCPPIPIWPNPSPPSPPYPWAPTTTWGADH